MVSFGSAAGRRPAEHKENAALPAPFVGNIYRREVDAVRAPRTSSWLGCRRVRFCSALLHD